MKKTLLRHAFFATLFVAGLSFTSCRDNNQNEGMEDAQETNADTYGSEGELDNEGSGSAAGTGTYSTDTATDTVQGTTTGGSPATTGAGTNNGGTETDNNGGM